MEKLKRITALLAVAVLLICALLTLVFALMGYQTAWRASAYCMVVLPILLYAMMLMYKILSRRGKEK